MEGYFANRESQHFVSETLFKHLNERKSYLIIFLREKEVRQGETEPK